MVGTPYNSGESERDQGISKAGNRRVRAMIVEIAWLWLRFQPRSALTQWYQARFARGAALNPSGPDFQLYVDNTLVLTGEAGLLALSSRLILGDGTGGANAIADITAFRFSQAEVIPEPATLMLFGVALAGIGFSRRRRTK